MIDTAETRATIWLLGIAAEQMEDLCGTILATLVVNRERKAFASMEEAEEFSKMIDGWRAKFGEIRDQYRRLE